MDVLWTTVLVAFGSAATLAAAVLATLAGALRPWVSVASLVVGGTAAVAAARAARGVAAAHRPGSRALDALALAAFVAVSVRQFGWVVFEQGGALLTLLPYNYGDLPLHWTYVAHFASGASFWPDNPILAGERLRYPVGVDLLTAALVQVGFSMRVLLVAMGLVGAAASALALRRWGGSFGVAGFLFSGSLAGFQALWTARLVDYDQAVPWKNLFLALLVPQRGFLLALPAGLLLLWSWRLRLLRGERGLPAWVEGLAWGAMPLVHLHTFLFVSIAAASWAVLGGRLRAARPALAWALVPAAWSTWQVTDGFRAVSLVGLHPGWMIGYDSPLGFLARNFGLFLPLAAAALVLAWRARRREELAVLAVALPVLAGLFLVKLAPWEWDNTKVMLWCYVAALAPIGSMVLPRLAVAWRVAVLALFLLPGAASVLGASLGRGPRLEVLDVAEHEGVCRALVGLRTTRVATAPTFNHPVALCGRPIVAGYAGHLWSHGLDASDTQRRLERLMRAEPGWREEARALGASHVFWGWREAQAFPTSKAPWRAHPPAASGPWGGLFPLD